MQPASACMQHCCTPRSSPGLCCHARSLCTALHQRGPLTGAKGPDICGQLAGQPAQHAGRQPPTGPKGQAQPRSAGSGTRWHQRSMCCAAAGTISPARACLESAPPASHSAPRSHRGLVIRTVLAALAFCKGLLNPKSLILTRQEASTSCAGDGRGGQRSRQAPAPHWPLPHTPLPTLHTLARTQGGKECTAATPPHAKSKTVEQGEPHQVGRLEVPVCDGRVPGVQELEPRGRIQGHAQQPLPGQLRPGLQGWGRGCGWGWDWGWGWGCGGSRAARRQPTQQQQRPQRQRQRKQ